MLFRSILDFLLDGLAPVVTDRSGCRFFCDCDKERVERAIISIGRKDIREMIDTGKPIEVSCQFCNTYYQFSVEELKRMLSRCR